MVDHQPDSTTACSPAVSRAPRAFLAPETRGIPSGVEGERAGTAGRTAEVTRSGLPAGGMPRPDRGGDRSEGLGHPAPAGFARRRGGPTADLAGLSGHTPANFASPAGQPRFPGRTMTRARTAHTRGHASLLGARGGAR